MQPTGRAEAGLALVALVVPLLLAGCAGGSGRPMAPEQPSPASSSSSMAPAPMLGNASGAAITATPFRWDGHTKEGAWVCTDQSGSGQCPAGQQVAPDGAYAGRIAYTGRLTRLELTMTWQADPTQTGLVLAAAGNVTGVRTRLATVQGDSPLALVLDLSSVALEPDQAVVIRVWPEGKTATSPSVFLDATQQPFVVEGTLTASR